MTESNIRTKTDLLAYLNQCPFEALLTLDTTEIDCACRIADIELSPWDDDIDRLEIELLHIDNLNPFYFTPETRMLITAKMLTAWSVKDEARMQCQGVLDAIQESCGFRGNLFEWIAKCEETIIQKEAM